MKEKRTLSNQETALFCEQMSMILKSGLTPMAGAELMQDDADTPQSKEFFDIITEKCNLGDSFPDALEATGVFPAYALDMIRIGNISGNLDEVLDALASHYYREDSIYESIRNAVTYPFVIISMMLAVIVVLLVKVLPIFQKVFNQLGSELTGLSAGLIGIGEVLRNYSVFFILLFFVLAVCFLFFTQTAFGRAKMLHFLSSFTLTKNFFFKIAAGRFASGMSITLAAGLDTDESLELVEPLVAGSPLESRVKKCRAMMDGVENEIPATFSEAIVETGIFNNVYTKMLGIGFSTGSSERVLKKIAENYDNEIEKGLNRLLSVLEPTLVIILSIIVCLILLSVIIPLLGIMASIG